MTEPNRARELALILQAIETLEREKDDYNKEWKARMQTLTTQAWNLRQDILSGQLSLVVGEPPKGDAA